MNELWKKLIEEFEAKGYEPEDIEMRVFFYESMI
jgi:hypothetical protein